MEEFRKKVDQLQIEFIEHRAKTEANYKDIKEDVDELKAEVKDFKKEVSSSFEDLKTSINNISLQLAKSWSLAIPKDPKTVALILIIIGSLLGLPMATAMPEVANHIPAIVDTIGVAP